MPARDRGAGPAGRRTAGAGIGDDGLVIGTVPATARLTGALLVLAGLAGGVAPVPTYLVVGGEELSLATGATGLLAALLVPLASAAVGFLLLRAAVPKFGLAYAAVAGALAVGQLLIEFYRGDSSTIRPGVEVLAGELVVTSSVSVGAGWLLTVVALCLLVLAGAVAAASWSRTVMDDDGRVDPLRPLLTGLAVLLGVTAVLALALPAADVPDQLVTDPVTGLQTVVTREGPQALLERPGLALLGGLLLAGSVVLCAVVAPSLRPRLAAVGGLLALAVTVLAAGAAGLRDALSSAELSWTVPGGGSLLAGAGFAVLTVVAWRARRTPPGEGPGPRE
ncbi:hypothetical protein OF117_03795 [Geodermatophilus sp. YIM 151500]|uniref:hypothetical protein n=1 Tax=Geodermatophilus sp. YIM 151500 TaxID=2984531 RepID=UPI0021E4F94E|nr:hypothetical protein [Geodermatophilus sp. YIM 151500]MCV2488476.1 hypothetical protein [Geodermatophilus sp. YIM 151500]